MCTVKYLPGKRGAVINLFTHSKIALFCFWFRVVVCVWWNTCCFQISWIINMGSFLEFVFCKFCWFCCLLNFFEACSKESIDGTADWFDNSPYFWSSKKKDKQNLEKINWRIGENKFEKRSHEWVMYWLSLSQKFYESITWKLVIRDRS